MTQVIKIELNKIETNKGQIEGLPANPRIIKNDKYRKLKKSIEENPEMLEYRELLVYPYNGKYIIIGGNMRYKAMKELGYKEAPVKIIDENATVEQLKAYTIKDNAGFGEWDGELIIKDWNLSELDAWGVDIQEEWLDERGEKETEEDNFDEATTEIPTTAKMGDLYQLGNHRLLCGDSTNPDDVKKLMNGELADLMVTDPPYNVDYSAKAKHLNEYKKKIGEYNKGIIEKDIDNDKMTPAQFHEFLVKVFTNANDSLKPGGVFYIWHPSKEVVNFTNATEETGLNIHQTLIWAKSNIVFGLSDYQWKHEPCLYGWKDGAAHYFADTRKETTVIDDTLDLDKMTKEELLNQLKSIYELPADVIYEKKPLRSELHPTMKPINLFGRLIKNSSREGEKVLDLFGGSGTTIMACEQLNRRAYLMEYDPHYVDVIIKRWEDYTGYKAVKLN